jgi:RNA 2',3'-cyclic 3'-phosphodiesterase
MRLFVGLPVDPEVRRALLEVIAPLRERHPGLRWTRPEGWHVTLAFLGEVTDEQFDLAVTSLRATLQPPPPAPSLSLGAPGGFGDRLAHVTVSDEPAGSVARLGAQVQAAFAAAEVPVHRRVVRPHLTLARGAGAAALAAPLATALGPVADPVRRWQPGSTLLYRSQLGAGGSTYGVAAEVSFAPAS